MIKQRIKDQRNLSILIVFCVVYAFLLQAHLHLTPYHQIEGITGVIIGMYSAAQPAANVLDYLFFHREKIPAFKYRKNSVKWVALNIGVLLAGLLLLVTSLLRYSGLN